MTHIVYITNGMAGAVNSSLELGRQLAAAGHRTTYLGPAEAEDLVTAHGHRFHRLIRDRELTRAAMQDRRPSSPVGWLPWLIRRRRLRRRSIENREIERLVTGLVPDVLVIDFEMHFAVIATAHLGIPTFLAIGWFSIFRQPGLPPLDTELQPDDPAVPRAWRRTHLDGLRRRWRRRLSPAGIGDHLNPVTYYTNYGPGLAALARSRHYSLRRKTSRRHWPRPFAYEHLPILSFNAGEMDFPHVRHPNLHYVGPMVHRERHDGVRDDRSYARWRDWERDHERDPTTPPVIYCSLGSFWSADRELLRRVLDIFRRRSDWKLVLGLGGKLSEQDLTPIPTNALVLDWAPQMEVLRLADCAITHGGINTVNECVLSEVPMVVYSTGHVDQNGCAARLAYHGLAVVGHRNEDSSETIERYIERALSDRELRDRLAAMRTACEAYEREGSAVALIEAALAPSIAAN